jgi:hypothetical protein
MERLVHSYLSQSYALEIFEITRYTVFKFDGDALYEINDDSKFRGFKNPSQLLSELNTIFFLTHDELKPMVLSWAKKIKEDVDLDKYWEYIESILPIAQQIASHTIGLDLVAVQPMSAPRGELLYFDYQYGIDEATGDSETVTATTVVGRQEPTNRNGRVYDEEIFRQSWGNIQQIYENQQNHIVGELDHPTPSIDITMTDRDDSAINRALNKWSSIIGVSSRRSE